MGLPMTGNLVKNGFIVKAFDINTQTLEKCSELVSLKTLDTIACRGLSLSRPLLRSPAMLTTS